MNSPFVIFFLYIEFFYFFYYLFIFFLHIYAVAGSVLTGDPPRTVNIVVDGGACTQIWCEVQHESLLNNNEGGRERKREGEKIKIVHPKNNLKKKKKKPNQRE